MSLRIESSVCDLRLAPSRSSVRDFFLADGRDSSRPLTSSRADKRFMPCDSIRERQESPVIYGRNCSAQVNENLFALRFSADPPPTTSASLKPLHDRYCNRRSPQPDYSISIQLYLFATIILLHSTLTRLGSSPRTNFRFSIGTHLRSPCRGSAYGRCGVVKRRKSGVSEVIRQDQVSVPALPSRLPRAVRLGSLRSPPTLF